MVALTLKADHLKGGIPSGEGSLLPLDKAKDDLG